MEYRAYGASDFQRADLSAWEFSSDGSWRMASDLPALRGWAKRPDRRFPSRSTRWRAVWSLLLVLHLLPFFSALTYAPSADAPGAAELLVRLVALSGSLGFFLLKIVDVPWLRLRPGRRSWVAAAGVVALMHVGAVQRSVFDAASPASFPLVATLAAGGLADPVPVRRALRDLTTHVVFSSSPVFCPRGVLGHWVGWADAVLFRLRPCPIAARAPRAPPFRCA